MVNPSSRLYRPMYSLSDHIWTSMRRGTSLCYSGVPLGAKMGSKQAVQVGVREGTIAKGIQIVRCVAQCISFQNIYGCPCSLLLYFAVRHGQRHSVFLHTRGATFERPAEGSNIEYSGRTVFIFFPLD